MGKSIRFVARPNFRLSTTADGVRAAWDAVPGAEKYRVLVSTTGNASDWMIYGDDTTALYCDIGLTASMRVYVSVCCVSADGSTYTSAIDPDGKSIDYVYTPPTPSEPTKPAEPETLATPALTSLANVSNGVTVKWNGVDGAAKYRVFYKISGGSWKIVGDTTAASYTVTGLQSGTRYTFTVRCVSADGKRYTSDYDRAGKSITYVAQPTVRALESVSGGVMVKWNGVSGAAKYRVYYKTAGGSWKGAGDTTGTSLTVKGLTGGTRYTFTLRCVSADGKNYTSDYDRTGKSITYLSQPAVRSAENTAGGVLVKWNTVPGAAKYRVFYKTAGSSWKVAGDTTGTGYTVTGLKSGTAYTFTVRCVTADGKGFTSSYDSKGVTLTVK